MFHCTCFQTAKGKQMKSRGRRLSAFICFRVFGKPVEQEARVFKITSHTNTIGHFVSN